MARHTSPKASRSWIYMGEDRYRPMLVNLWSQRGQFLEQYSIEWPSDTPPRTVQEGRSVFVLSNAAVQYTKENIPVYRYVRDTTCILDSANIMRRPRTNIG